MNARKNVDAERLLTLYRSGMSQKEIAAELGIAHTTVRYWLKKTGETIRDRKRISKSDLIKICKLYDDGWSAKRIARELGFSDVAIVKRLREMGVEINSKPQKLLIDKEVAQLYSQGMTIKEVAGTLGCGKGVVSRSLKRQDIDATNPFIMPAYVSPYNEAEVIGMYQRGMTSKEVGDRIGSCSWTVLNILRKNNISRKVPQPRFIADDQKVADLYTKKKLSIAEISHKLGIAYTTVTYSLERSGIPRRDAGGTIRMWKRHGRPLKLASGWEAVVYEILFKEFGDDDLLFQGDFTCLDRKAPVVPLIKPKKVLDIYAPNKSTYDWNPDFVIPSLNLVFEVKGNNWARSHWDSVILPSIENTKLSYNVAVLYDYPNKCKTWDDLKALMVTIS